MNYEDGRRIGAAFALAETIRVLVAADKADAVIVVMEKWRQIEDAGASALDRKPEEVAT